MRAFVLRTEQNAAALYAFLKVNWRALAEQGKPLAVTVAEHKAKRNTEQNKKMHADFTEISEQAWVDGKQFSPEAWKEHYKRKFIGTEEFILPSGEIEIRGISTTSLDVGGCADFITKYQRDAIENFGVQFPQ